MFEVGLITIFEIKIEYISLEDSLSRGKSLAPLIILENALLYPQY